MAELPASPISPAEFFASWLPRAFAEAELPEDLRRTELRLGVLLHGEGGGEWVCHLKQGALQVRAEPRTECPFTVVQSVEDWRGALWEGRGGALGQQAAAMFRPGAGAQGGGGAMPAPTPAALQKMGELDGVIRMRVSGGEDDAWQVDFKLGPGALPDEPTTTVSIGAEDAEKLATGALDPMQAFLQGRIQVAGDIALMMQMQAIQMQSALAGASSPGSAGGASEGGSG